MCVRAGSNVVSSQLVQQVMGMNTLHLNSQLRRSTAEQQLLANLAWRGQRGAVGGVLTLQTPGTELWQQQWPQLMETTSGVFQQQYGAQATRNPGCLTNQLNPPRPQLALGLRHSTWLHLAP
jgi:hypothetical protein